MSIRKKKIKRLLSGESPRVLDLFAGCGGLSLGFHKAGYELKGGIEYDRHAARTHGNNFFAHLPDEKKEFHCLPRDITETDPVEFINAVNHGSGEPAQESIDTIIGGPPCQAFSIVGRAKLREIMDHPEAHMQDKRASLSEFYLSFVEELQPLVVLMENVPEILRFGGKNVAQGIAEHLEELGYQVRYTVLNSVFYGVPQLRDRMFLIGFANELGMVPEFPEPEHFYDLPKGYLSLRKDVTRRMHESLFGSKNNFIVPPENLSDGLPAVTSEDAMGDLPEFNRHLRGELKRGAKRLDEFIPYPDDVKPGSYGKLMRNWPSFESQDGIYDHMIRYLPRDYDIFARMQPGDEYPQAHRTAEALFEEKLKKLKKKGIHLQEGDEDYALLKKKTVPPYDPTKFANKWRKLDADEPSRTLTAHIGKDTYSHIHYSSEQARTISVREAARLQSFPDGFRFSGTLDPALKQIGNSVPPLMSYALARSIKQQLAENLGINGVEKDSKCIRELHSEQLA